MNIIRETLLNMLETSDYPSLKKKPTLKSRMVRAILESDLSRLLSESFSFGAEAVTR